MENAAMVRENLWKSHGILNHMIRGNHVSGLKVDLQKT